MANDTDATANMTFLRDLAFQLDLQLGVDQRKRILAGHEKRRLLQDPVLWEEWIKAVAERVETRAGGQSGSKLMRLVRAGRSANKLSGSSRW